MATQIAGPVLLPDGSIPTHGRVIFRPNRPIVGENIVTAAPVIAPITAGEIDVTLEAEAAGSPYSVTVEHWSVTEGRLIETRLPAVVPTGTAGPFTIAGLAAVEIPANASSHAAFKRGDTISLGGRWLDEHGRPMPLTGLTVSAALRGPDGQLRPLLVVVTDAATGLVEITLSASQSAALPLGRHRIDVKMSSGVRVSRTQTGTITIIEEVTP